MSYMTGDDILSDFNRQLESARLEHQKHVDEFIYQLWHDAKVEQPKFEAWILMADAHGHYMAAAKDLLDEEHTVSVADKIKELLK